jgi:selenocysteine lyase/cysteine desulfurase
MPVAESWAYFDHAAVAPLCEPARRALIEYADDATEHGDTRWLTWSRRVEDIRAAAARLVNVTADEIAFVPNTTAGIALVAEGFPWTAGDNVVTLDNEFPSNQYPWLNLATRGVETRRVPISNEGRIDYDRLAAACDRRTRIVAVSWIGYATGFRADVARLAQIAHDCGARFFLDAIQGLGAFPLDVRATGIDYFAADGHKWLLGPEGAGLFYIRADRLEELRPQIVGWHSVAHSGDYTRIELNFKPSAQRFEGGSQNMPGVLALGASIDLLLDLGIDNIAKQIVANTDDAAARLQSAGATIHSPRDANCSSGILSFTLPNEAPEQTRRRALAANIALSCRAGRLRISPHAYNNAADLARLLEVVEANGE